MSVPAKRALILAAGAVCLWSLAAGQQTRPQEKAPPAKNGDRPWRLEFDEFFHSDATGKGEATDVVATSDHDTVIRTDLFRWDEKARTAQATGNLHMSDDQAEGTADKADIEYGRGKRLMILTGHVQLTLKPRKDAESGSAQSAGSNEAQAADGSGRQTVAKTDGVTREEDETAGLREYPIEVTCDRVEYQYARDKRHAVLTGSFRAVQKLKDYTRTLVAERAEWFGNEERIVLSGPVRLEDTKGRKGETPEDVTIYTRKGQESIKLRKGTYSIPAEDDETPTTTPPDRVPPRPGAAGAGDRPAPTGSPSVSPEADDATGIMEHQ